MSLHYNAPALIFTIRYSLAEIATLFYRDLRTADGKTVYSSVGAQVAAMDNKILPHFNDCAQALISALRFNTPKFSGMLRESIVRIEQTRKDEGTVTVSWPFWSQTEGGEVEINYSDKEMTQYTYLTTAIHTTQDPTNPGSYAMHVEVGTDPHTPPLQKISNWATAHGIYPYALQTNISKSGTPAKAMFLGTSVVGSVIISSVPTDISLTMYSVQEMKYTYTPGDLVA